jgi:hypothetical protein
VVLVPLGVWMHFAWVPKVLTSSSIVALTVIFWRNLGIDLESACRTSDMKASGFRKNIRKPSAAFQICVHRWIRGSDTATSGMVRRRPAHCPTVGPCRRVSCRAFTPSLITAFQLWKRENSIEEQGFNVVAKIGHGYRHFGDPYFLQPQCRSTCILQNLLVGCENVWVIDGYQFSEEHVFSSSMWKYLYTDYCGSGCFKIL